MMLPFNRPAAAEMRGGYDLRGSYRLLVSSGAVTTVAARSPTAGHLLAFRWAPASLTDYNAYIRYIGAKFTLTTAFGSAQEVGCDLIAARGYTASHTGATAVDLGSTVTNTNKFRTAQPTSLAGVAGHCRVADTGALTAGTHTLDANPIGILSDWAGAIGATIPAAAREARSGFGTLFDARDNNFPLVLADDEGLVIRNLILMGATGVGRWDFCIEWDEGKPNGN